MGIVSRLAAVGCLLVVGCGGPPEVRAPDGTITPVKATTTEVGAPEKHVVKRPEDVVAWIHVDDPDGILDLLDVASSPVGAEVNEWLDKVDTKQPFDVAVVMNDEKDPEVAIRIPVKDSAAVLKKLGVFFTLKEQGARVFARDGEDEEAKPVFECDFSAPTRGPDIMICGIGKAIDVTGEWLRNAPVPKRENGARTTGNPLARLNVYGNGMRKATAGSHEKELVELVKDVDVMSFELDREGTKLALAGVMKLSGQTTDISKQMLMPTPGGPPNESFSRVWDVASAAVFSPGGGPIPIWVKEIMTEDDKSSPKSKIAEKMSKLFEKSFSAGYGVRSERVKAGVLAMRTGKDKDKAKKQLGDALEGQMLFSIGLDSTAVQTTLKDAIPTWNADAKKWSSGNQKPFDRYSLKPAAAKLGLPKGSFVLEETQQDWSAMSAVSPTGPTPPTPKLKTEPTIFVPDGATTWGFMGGDEAAVLDLAKKVIANKAKPAEVDPLFKRSGVVAAGYFASSVGAFGMHRYDVLYGNPTPDVLADLEKDATAPRMPLSFVVTNEKKGEGGNVAFEISGERAAVLMLGEHASKSFLGSVGYLLMALMPHPRNHSPIP